MEQSLSGRLDTGCIQDVGSNYAQVVEKRGVEGESWNRHELAGCSVECMLRDGDVSDLIPPPPATKCPSSTSAHVVDHSVPPTLTLPF